MLTRILADSSPESDSDSPVVKKAKYAGEPKYKSKFKKDWIVKYPFVSSVTSDESLFHCIHLFLLVGVVTETVA